MSDSDSSGSVTDSFTEVTSTSWLSRLGNAIVGVLIGLVLIIGSGVFLFWNEGRAVQTYRSLAEGAGLVIDVDAGKVEPANDGKLVHVSGDIKTTAPLTDPEFGVSSAAVQLTRTVEMFQWKEESKTETHKNLGGSEEKVTTYTYVQEWSESRNDSSKFKRPDGHNNPQMRYSRYEAVAKDASLGAFHPSERVLRLLPAADELRVEAATATRANERLRINAQAVDGKLYIGADPSTPRIGDLRISYRIGRPGPASMTGRQAGSDFADYQTQAGDRILMAHSGIVSAADMFQEAKTENRILTWALRIVGAVVMFFGFFLLFRPLVVVGDVVPFIGDVLGTGAGLAALVLTLVAAPVIIGVAWFFYRPVIGITVLAGGLVLGYALKHFAGRRVTTNGAKPANAS